MGTPNGRQRQQKQKRKGVLLTTDLRIKHLTHKHPKTAFKLVHKYVKT